MHVERILPIHVGLHDVRLDGELDSHPDMRRVVLDVMHSCPPWCTHDIHAEKNSAQGDLGQAWEGVLFLLGAGASTHSLFRRLTDRQQELLLTLACASRTRSHKALEWMLRHGGNADATANDHMRTPLIHVAFEPPVVLCGGVPSRNYGYGDKCVRVLLAHGANVNAVRHTDYRLTVWDQSDTLLLSVCGWARGASLRSDAAKKDVAMVSLLLSAGADIEAQFGEVRRSSLHFAVITGKPEVTELLLQHGASWMARDCKGHTPLFFALQYRRPVVLQSLLAWGATLQECLSDEERALAESSSMMQAMQSDIECGLTRYRENTARGRTVHGLLQSSSGLSADVCRLAQSFCGAHPLVWPHA